MSDDLKIKMETKQRLEVNGIDMQLFAEQPPAANDFFNNNKKTTEDYRTLYAQAIGATGTIPKITQMAFGTAGEADSQGNPAPPTGNGPLNNVVLIKDLKSITFPTPTTVCCEAEIVASDGLTCMINEVALLDENKSTAYKIRLLTSKGIDVESGLIFRWYIEF